MALVLGRLGPVSQEAASCFTLFGSWQPESLQHEGVDGDQQARPRAVHPPPATLLGCWKAWPGDGACALGLLPATGRCRVPHGAENGAASYSSRAHSSLEKSRCNPRNGPMPPMVTGNFRGILRMSRRSKRIRRPITSPMSTSEDLSSLWYGSGGAIPHECDRRRNTGCIRKQ